MEAVSCQSVSGHVFTFSFPSTRSFNTKTTNRSSFTCEGASSSVYSSVGPTYSAGPTYCGILPVTAHRAAVIWGGAGEGKATVALAAAARLRDEEPGLRAVELDMQGEAAALRSQRHAEMPASFSCSDLQLVH